MLIMGKSGRLSELQTWYKRASYKAGGVFLDGNWLENSEGEIVEGSEGQTVNK
jgi:hypothetical protein